jgi:putative transposase
MRKYPTCMTDSQWQILSKLLVTEKRNRKHSFREIFDALFFIVKSGGQWRMLPSDFPKWQLVYYYFRKFSANGFLEMVHDKLVTKVRKALNREESPSLGLLDSQSVKSSSMTDEKGLDANKKINGRKRFIVTDTVGLILALVVTSATVQDREGAKLVFKELAGKYSRLSKILGDQGFGGPVLGEWVKKNCRWGLEVVRKVLGISGFYVLPKRWVVERTFGWMMFQRRLVKDYEVKTEHSVGFIHVAMIRIMLRRIKPHVKKS